MNVNLKFSEHVKDICLKATQRANWLLRSFIVTNINLYIILFRVYILPILLYASPVWNSRLLKDLKMLETVQNRYFRRAAYKCNISRESIAFSPVYNLLNDADLNMYSKLEKLSVANDFFDFHPTNTRRGVVVRSKYVACKSAVSNLFSHRVTRLLRDPA